MPARDDETSAAVHILQGFVVVKVEVAVHPDGIHHYGAREILPAVAATVHGERGVGRDEYAGELAVAVQSEGCHGAR